MATEQALRVTRYSEEFAQNRVPNILGFNQDGRNDLFVVASGSGTVAGLPGEYYAGNMSLILNPGDPANDFEVNAGESTRTRATRNGRYMFVFAIFIPVDVPTDGDIAYVKLARNGAANWTKIVVKSSDITPEDVGKWVVFFKDYAPVPANSEFDWSFGICANPDATSIAFDGVGMYFCDDRELGFPPRYSFPYKSLPSAAEMPNGLYAVRREPLRVSFETTSE